MRLRSQQRFYRWAELFRPGGGTGPSNRYRTAASTASLAAGEADVLFPSMRVHLNEPMRILVVDGVASSGTGLAQELANQGHDTTLAADGQQALARLERDRYDLVFADVKAPHVDGIQLLRRIKGGSWPETAVVVMSSNGSVSAAVEAVRRGAFDFVAKPLSAAEIAAIVARLEQCRPQISTRRPVGAAPPHGVSDDEKSDLDRSVVGTSEAMSRVKHMLKVSARCDANVLIYGETGVGKDLVASVIHRHSHRQPSAFVKVGCTLFPPSLIESELYGHEEGSYTGADQARKGRFELAEGGTIYLDDVDDIPLAQQVKLLRVIEEKVFERVGGNKPIKANVRIVASSKKNLLMKIGEGTFRADLYYRLDVLRIRIPPLRERRADIPALTEHLLQRIAVDEPYRLDPQAVVLLARHDWPGNVRELYHSLERAYLMGGGHISAELIQAEMVGLPSADAGTDGAVEDKSAGFQAVMQHAEKQLLFNALEACGGNKTAAAQSLGMKASTFRDKLTKHGVK